MLKLLRMWLNPADAAAAASPRRSRRLRLPAGVIIAEQGLQHLPDCGEQRSVLALLDEAYVVMRLDSHTCWYATWQPYLGRWELLHLDETEPAAIDSPLDPLPVRASAQ